LLEDLSSAGLLDETLVIWNSEFGRTPTINSSGGRDHWGPCNSVVLAGGGVPGGQVFGATDDKAAYPTSDKVTQDDIAATMYHLMGLDPETLIHDKTERPFPLALGQPIVKLLGGQARPEPAPAPATRVTLAEFGPFGRLLRERGNRFLTVALGHAESEKLWDVTGFSEPSGEGLTRHRTLGESAARVRFKGFYYNHFDYGWCVVRLASPAVLAGTRLQLGGTVVPYPAELDGEQPSSLWQIPLPRGLMGSLSSLEISLTAPGWQVTDLAVVGDPIRSEHLEMLGSAWV
jgi:hypothetical protein